MAWTKDATTQEVFRSTDGAGVESVITVTTANGAVSLRVGSGTTQGPLFFGDAAKVKAAFTEVGALLS